MKAISLAVLLVLFSTFKSSFASDNEFYPLDTICNPIHSITCGLPFPSDVYAHPDEFSPTGKTLYYPDGVVRDELFDNVPPTLTPQKVVNGSSGFSAASSVMFELESEPNVLTLPEDGGESVIAINLRTGERVPIRVKLNEYARSFRVATPSQIIEIFPRSRWQFGDRYGVFLTNALKPLNKDNFEVSEGFNDAIANDNSPLANFYEPVISQYEQLGYSRDELISATFFTVRDEWEVTGKLTQIGETVYDKDHPIKNLRIRYKLFGDISAHVSGEVLVHNFRDEYGGIIYDENHVEENWIEFRLTLPRAAKNGPVPVAIFSHGIGFIKESGLSTAKSNAKMGIATIAIDHPNHGTRTRKDGGYSLFRLRTPYVAMQVGMMVQSSIDHMSLLKAIQTSIGELDVLPKRFWSPLFTRKLNNGDGIPDIDTNKIFYLGVSLGGVLGSTFLSIAPDIKGAYLQVTGVGVTNILSGSALWDPFFSHLVPNSASGAEALLLKSAMQHELDYGDAINFVHYLRNPIGIGTPKLLAVAAGKNDNVVPNFSTVALAEIAELPLIGDEYFPLPTSERLEDFDEGYGIVQFEVNKYPNNEFLNGFATHFGSGKGETRKNWIQRFILDD